MVDMRHRGCDDFPMDHKGGYEVPTLERVGTVADLTAAAGDINSDDHIHANNAYSNP